MVPTAAEAIEELKELHLLVLDLSKNKPLEATSIVNI